MSSNFFVFFPSGMLVRKGSSGNFFRFPAKQPVVLDAPTISGITIPDVVYVQNTGIQEIDSSVGFIGDEIVYTIPTPVTGVSIDANTGAISISTTSILAESVITVRATNSTDFVELSFYIQVIVSTFFISAFTYEEIRNSVEADGVTGKQRLTVGAFSIPGGMELRYYSGLLPYVAGSFATIHNTTNSPQITPGGVTDTSTGFDVDESPNGVLLGREIASNTWWQASDVLNFTVEGIISVTLPTFTVTPHITGTLTIGSTLTAAFTAIDTTLSSLFQWYRSGIAIAGATNSTYVTVGADDVKAITVKVTARNGNGNTAHTSPAVTPTYAPSATSNTIPTQSFSQQASGVYSADFDITGYFTGNGITYSISGHSAARVRPDGHFVALLQSVVNTVQVTITASNSFGSANQSFNFQIIANTPTIAWPANITSGMTFSEVTDVTQANINVGGAAGRLKVVSSGLTIPPAAGFTTHYDITPNGIIGATPAALPTINANETKYGTISFSVGDSARPRGFYKHTATGLWKLAYDPGAFIIQGLDTITSTSWPAISGTGTATGQARSKPYPNWSANGLAPSNAGYYGHPLACAAYASFQGDRSCDAYVVDGIKDGKNSFGGPGIVGGFANQFDINYVAAVYWASREPLIWSQFTSTEKANLDYFMKAAAVAAAGAAREANITTFSGTHVGTSNFTSTGGNPNYRNGPEAIVLCVGAYLGSMAVLKSYLDAVDVSTLQAGLNSRGWTNLAIALRTTGRPSNAPTIAQITSRIRNWTRFGVSISNAEGLLKTAVEYSFDKTASLGVTGGQVNASLVYNFNNISNNSGIPANNFSGSGAWANGRGRFNNMASVAADPIWPAISGKIGKCHELETVDAGGPRSSMEYSQDASRMTNLMAMVALTSGMVDPQGAVAQSLKSRLYVGYQFNRLAAVYGYLGVAHVYQGGLPSNPESPSSWKSGGGTWSNSNSVSWGLAYSDDMGRVINLILS